MRKRLLLRKKLLASLITAAVAASVVPAIAWAQSADSALRGKAPANGEVTAKNVATGAVRRTKSAADGSYSLVGLPPGTYQVDAGPGTERTVTLTVASTATLDLAATPAGAPPTTTLEGVTVNATTLTEVKTSEIGTTVSLHQIQTVPQITRNFLEFADTVPGMVFNVDGAGNTKLQGGAQSGSAINVYIDGVGQKNYVLQGGISGQDSSQGNPFPQLAIGEYKVITSNYKAEYDQIGSAAVTAETKSGTNDFHGEVFGTYTDDHYRDETPAEKHAGKQTQSQEKEYGFAVGGPIIQDTMHFFFTYEGKKFNTPTAIVSGVPQLDAFLPANVSSQIGSGSLPFTEDLYFGKIDWEFSDRDRLEFSAKVRKEDQIGNIGGTQATSFGSDTKNSDNRFDLRWQHSADRWFNEVLLNYEDAKWKPTPTTFGNASIYTFPAGVNNDQIILQTGGGQNSQNKGQKGPALQDDLTFNNINWHGDHTVKMGIKFKEVDLTAQQGTTENPRFFYDVTSAGTSPIPYKVDFQTAVSGVGTPVVKSKDKQLGTYIQDDWVVNDKLTLNLGVRWDYDKNPSYLNFVTPARATTALLGPDPNAPGQSYAQSLANGGININDYISNGHNRKAIKDEWQPRLGFSYDINADEQHVVIGGIGRSYDRDLYDYLQVEQSDAQFGGHQFFFNNSSRTCDTTASNCINFDPKYLNGVSNLQALVPGNTPGEYTLINNDLKVPYSDQISLGMRNKIGDWNTSATVARIVSKNGLVFTLGNRPPSGFNFLQNGQAWGDGIPGIGSLILGNSGIETKNNQLLLSADKPYTRDSGWGVTLAYTYSDAKENLQDSQRGNNHYAFDGPNIGYYPFQTSNAVSKHRFVSTGTIDGPWGFTYSAKLVLATPLPIHDIGCYGAPGPCGPHAFIPPGKRFLFGGDVFGTRDIDFSINKNFDLTRGMSIYLRGDLLNAFNYKNINDYIVNWGANGVLNPMAVYNTSGGISTPTRTFKLTLGFRF